MIKAKLHENKMNRVSVTGGKISKRKYNWNLRRRGERTRKIKIFEKIMTKHFPNLMKTKPTYPGVSMIERPRGSSMINTEKPNHDTSRSN